MAVYTSKEKILAISLRVPSLFVLDSILRNSFLRTLAPEHKTPFYVACWALFIAFCSIAAIFLFTLPIRYLCKTYKFLVAGFALTFSYYCNANYVEVLTRHSYISWTLWCILTIAIVLIQMLLGAIYNYSLTDANLPGADPFNFNSLNPHVSTWFRSYINVTLISPVLFSFMGLPMKHLHFLPTVIFLLVILEYHIVVLSKVTAVAHSLSTWYKSSMRYLRHFGIQHFMEIQWNRLHVPNVLRTFWLTRLAIFTVMIICEYWNKDETEDQETLIMEYNLYHRFSPLNYENLLKNQYHAQNLSVSVLEKQEKTWMNLVLVLLEQSLVQGCDTFVALLGMTSILSRLAHYAGLGLSWFIQSTNEEDRSIGTMTAMLFFILALQTGLIGMKPEQRLVRLGRNMFLLTTAILHFIHGMLNPVLLNLSASQHHLLHKHVRPLIMCALLIIFPSSLLVYLWQRHPVSTWSLAVTAFSVEVIIKVSLSLLTYTLFMIDAYRDTFWEGLDDCIYYIKALGNCIEFVFGIFLFCNGAWILIFESGGAIRAVMMCIHAYFNIWGQAKEGWQTFMRRRSAVSKINSLPEASEAELTQLNDVCAICYQELRSARITRCRHYFHGVCLRKWLYVQDVCPLCHETVYAAESEVNTPDAVPENVEGEQDPNEENEEWALAVEH